MYKNEKFSFKLMISVNGYTEKPTSKDYNKISFEEKEVTISELEQFIKQGYIFSCTYIDKEIKSLFGYKKKERALHTNIIVFDIEFILIAPYIYVNSSIITTKRRFSHPLVFLHASLNICIYLENVSTGFSSSSAINSFFVGIEN